MGEKRKEEQWKGQKNRCVGMERGGRGNQRESSESLNTKMVEAISQRTKRGLANGCSLFANFWLVKLAKNSLANGIFPKLGLMGGALCCGLLMGDRKRAHNKGVLDAGPPSPSHLPS